MGLSELQATRRQKVDDLRAAGVDPYPVRSGRTHTVTEALALFEGEEAAARPAPADMAAGGEAVPPADVETAEPVTVAGRLMTVRHMGKTAFGTLRDGSGEIQLYVRRDVVGDGAFAQFLKLFDLGDVIEATGKVFRTRAGEVSVRTTDVGMLTKALNAPPEKWHGLTDVETRYRQRYADLIANAEVRRVFQVRSRAVTATRRFLDERGFLEVETPTLQPLYGGAAARPFTTVHNALDQTLYLRIADELYLKRLVVGGFERVYEICKDFRNEGIDRYHSPEFTMLEFYQAYADYRDVMALTEDLIVTVARETLGTLQITYLGQAIDLSPPWPRLSLRQAILDRSGVDYVAHAGAESLLAAARAAGADVATGTVWPKIVDELLKQCVRPTLIQPAFLVDYPVSLSPLAKRKPDDPTHVERFQPFIGGAEVGNGFTELNDPLDQLARFQDQRRDREAGDDETMPIDTDFVNALMYGMPPTGGVGIGIDRLTMLLTDQDGIRDVVLFPAMRALPPESDPMAPLANVEP